MVYTSEHPIFSVTVDIVVLTIRDERLCALVVERGGEPFKGRWALPGGFVEPDEGLYDAARRELEEETGVGVGANRLEQLASYGDPDRDPRGRIVSVATADRPWTRGAYMSSIVAGGAAKVPGNWARST